MLRHRLLPILLCAACAKAVAPDAKSGEDAELDGAEEIILEDDAAQVKDTVSFPGGDRVDWKFFTLEKGGGLELTLKWEGGKDLSFVVLDEYFHVVGEAKPRDTPGKPKKYVLREAFTIEEITKTDDQFVVSGPGKVLLPPAELSGKEFEKFKSACANFIGFRKIDDQAYTETLRQFADANAKAKLSPACEKFCDELVAAFPKMGDSYYYRAHTRRHLGNASGAKAM